ncbi:MAG: hypothetical protein H0T51_03165 [Pirellulales bacterium]|nr:hypothetical protein [Pirellulales bacterium]
MSVQSDSSWTRAILSSAGMCLALILGCGDGRPERAKVSGHVLIDGQPLTKGSIRFVPAQGRPAGSSLDESGRFELTCFEPGDGAILGEYRVAIRGAEYLSETLLKWHAPKKYSNAETSDLTATVDEPRDDLNFELTWDGGKPFQEKTQ